MIDGPTPMHLFEASKPGTGKGLLVRVLTAIFAGGTGADETTLPTVEEEVRKKLFSLLMEGVPYIYFDNINERVDSGTLASTLTSQTFRDRKLGVSETYYVPVRCCWIGSGNNPVMSNEITRRTVRCRLVAGIEHPHLRTEFKHPELFAYLRQHRGRFVGAVLTLIQAWIAEGRPSGAKTLGTYEAWAQVIGGILSVAGVSGFLENIESFYAEADDEGAAWRSFVTAWWEQLGPERQTATDLLILATDAGLPFVQWQYEKQKAELGTMLRKQADNVYSGFAIKKTKAPRGANSAYRLEPKEGQTWVPPTADDSSVGRPNGLFRNDSRVLLRASEPAAPRAGEA